MKTIQSKLLNWLVRDQRVVVWCNTTHAVHFISVTKEVEHFNALATQLGYFDKLLFLNNNQMHKEFKKKLNYYLRNYAKAVVMNNNISMFLHSKRSQIHSSCKKSKVTLEHWLHETAELYKNTNNMAFNTLTSINSETIAKLKANRSKVTPRFKSSEEVGSKTLLATFKKKYKELPELIRRRYSSINSTNSQCLFPDRVFWRCALDWAFDQPWKLALNNPSKPAIDCLTLTQCRAVVSRLLLYYQNPRFFFEDAKASNELRRIYHKDLLNIKENSILNNQIIENKLGIEYEQKEEEQDVRTE